MHVVRPGQFFTPDLFINLFFRTNTAIDRRNIQTTFVWRYRPPLRHVAVCLPARHRRVRRAFGSGQHTFFTKATAVFRSSTSAPEVQEPPVRLQAEADLTDRFHTALADVRCCNQRVRRGNAAETRGRSESAPEGGDPPPGRVLRSPGAVSLDQGGPAWASTRGG